MASAQRELDDARDSLLRLERRRRQLGVPSITNTDDIELPDDVSLLSDDHAHSVGSRSTMFIGTVGATEKSNSGFSLKNSIRNLRGKGAKNSYDSRSVSSAPAIVKRSGGEEYAPLNSPPASMDEIGDSPTKRSVTPERGEKTENNDENDNNDKNREDSSAITLFAASPTVTASTAPTESPQEDNEDEPETIESETSNQHYDSPKKETETEKNSSTEEIGVAASFEPMQIDMVTMDTIMEEPVDPEDGVELIEVTKCGIPQINGSYLKFDARDGVPTYSKIEKFESYETMFSIGRWTAANGNKKWYITAIVPGQSPPMKSVFYVAYSASYVPPKEGWMVVDEGFDLFLTPEYKERGVATAPILEWEVDDGVASVANTHISRRSSVSNSHYYEVGQQVLNGLTRDKDKRSLDGR